MSSLLRSTTPTKALVSSTVKLKKHTVFMVMWRPVALHLVKFHLHFLIRVTSLWYHSFWNKRV
jgi:hypothetical protein